MKVPKQLIIEVTNRCNLRCKGCPTCAGTSAFPVGDMDYEYFTTIIDRAAVEMPDASICLWMLGEPFLHPRYGDMCRYVSRAGLKFYVTTNLTVWREDAIRFLLSPESTCYQIIVSMDGMPGSGNIDRARPGTDEELLLANVGKLIALKRETGSSCDIAVKICERGQDHGEIEEYVQDWLGKVDYVCVGRMLTQENETSMRRHPCQEFDSQFLAIRWNGSLILCDYNLKAANELDGSYGTLGRHDSLLAAYNCRELQERRMAQNAGTYWPPCDTCGIAYTGAGVRGEIVFRDRPHRKVYFRQDYYNTFYSLVDRRKPDSYYAEVKA